METAGLSGKLTGARAREASERGADKRETCVGDGPGAVATTGRRARTRQPAQAASYAHGSDASDDGLTPSRVTAAPQARQRRQTATTQPSSGRTDPSDAAEFIFLLEQLARQGPDRRAFTSSVVNPAGDYPAPIITSFCAARLGISRLCPETSRCPSLGARVHSKVASKVHADNTYTPQSESLSMAKRPLPSTRCGVPECARRSPWPCPGVRAMNGGLGGSSLYEDTASRSSLEAAPQPLHIPAKRLAYGQADCGPDPMASAGAVLRQPPWASAWPSAADAFEAPHHVPSYQQQSVRDSPYFYPDRKPSSFNLWASSAKAYDLGPADSCQAYASQAWCPYSAAAATYPVPQPARVDPAPTAVPAYLQAADEHRVAPPPPPVPPPVPHPPPPRSDGFAAYSDGYGLRAAAAAEAHGPPPYVPAGTERPPTRALGSL
ncbi:hypothetical protein ISCGN_005142 [Ixodes scapularis]